MATYQREELVRAALLEIGALDANEAPDAVDAVLVNDRIQQKFELLYEEGLLPFDIDGVIPGRYFGPLMDIVAETLLLPFGKAGRAPIGIRNAERGMAQLWKFREKADFDTPTQACPY